MANKKINELSSRTPALSDLMIVGDPSSGYSYKCTVTALATIIETDIADGYVTIGTTQTISGAKTFSNNLTLTSVANATTTQSKFLTLNGSNVVNYRTGAEVLTDIGGQASLSGTGLVKSTSGTISYITDNSSNWNTAYNDSIVSAAVSGTTTKTLTLTQQDGGTLTASWSDLNTDAVTSVFGRTGAVVATEGDYTLTQLGDVTITTPSTGQVLKYNGTIWVNDTDANTGTVTSVALSTGTTGTDISVSGSPITSSGTITLNIPTASATNRGALSSTDWSTFNGKQNAITLTTTGSSGSATFVSNTLNIPTYTLAGLGGISLTSLSASSPLSYNSGTGAFSISQSSGSTNGFLSSTDWNTFNNKQNALTLTTTGTSGAATLVGSTLNIPQYQSVLTNPVTGSGTTNYIPKFTSSSAIGNSQIFDNGTSVGIGVSTINVESKLSVAGGAIIVSGNTGTDRQVLELTTSSGVALLKASYVGTSSFGDLAFSTGGSERMRLTSGGLLGLGTSSPSRTLSIGGAANAYMDFKSSSNRTYTIGSDSNGFIVFDDNASAYRMVINASGNLGLGTSSPTARFHSYTTGQTAGLFQSTQSEVNLRLDNSSATSNFFGATGANFYWNSGGAERMRLDASGNLGLGVTPSAWISTYRALQIGFGSSIVGRTDNTTFYQLNNAYRAADGTNYYLRSGETATQFAANLSGQYIWYQAPSGTAGNAISFTQAMTLDASGNLAIGSTTALGKLQISTSSGTTIFRSVVALGGTANADNLSIKQDFLTGVAANYLWSNSNYMLGVGRNGGTMPTTEADAIALSSLVVNSSGRVGIGTTSPTKPLHIYSGDANGNIYLTRASSSEYMNIAPYYTVVNGNDYLINVSSSNNLRLFTNDTERMRITSGGQVGIGTTSPTSYGVGYTTLEVSGSTSGVINVSTGSTVLGQLSNGTNQFKIDAVGASSSMLFLTNTNEKMRLTSAGELLINTTSDAGDYKLQVNGNTYGNGTAYFTGNIGIGVTPSADVVLYSTKALSGSVFPTGIFLGGIISGTSTSAAVYFNTNAITENTTFTLPHLYHYRAAQGTFGASSTVTNQYGFIVANSLTSATNNFAFYGDLAAATGRWNLYMNGTANNYMNGNLGIGVTTPTEKLEVNGAIKTAAPSGGTAKPWKLGEAGVTLGGSNTSGVRVEIDGVVYYLVTGYLP